MPKARLFHIKCIDEYVRTIEVFCNAESLNSNDSFVYLGQYKTYIWYGKVNNLLKVLLLCYTSFFTVQHQLTELLRASDSTEPYQDPDLCIMLAVLAAGKIWENVMLSQEIAPNVGKIVYPCFENLMLDLLKLKLMPTPLK